MFNTTTIYLLSKNSECIVREPNFLNMWKTLKFCVNIDPNTKCLAFQQNTILRPAMMQKRPKTVNFST